MFKARITSIKPVRHQATNKEVLDVCFEIVETAEKSNKTKIVRTRRIGFPIDTDRKTIVAEIEEFCTAEDQRIERDERNAKNQEQQANVEKLQEALVGTEIEPKGRKLSANKQ